MGNLKLNTGRLIPQVDFPAQYKSISKEINQAIIRVLEKGWYILGPEVASFESELAAYNGVKHVVGVASGTDALALSLKALGFGSGDEVIMPANVYPTAFGVAASGVDIKLADVDPKTLNLSLDSVSRALTPKTKAIILVHLYGHPIEIGPISKLAKSKNIKIIEDCAQAIGAEYQGQKVGSFGDIACLSFYPTKNLGGYGDAGAIMTNHQDLYEKSKLLRMYGETERYQSIVLSSSSRLDELQAAILRVKLESLDHWNKLRLKIAKRYIEAFESLPVEVIKPPRGCQSVYHLFVIKTTLRDQLASFLKSKGISIGVHYPIPIHLTPSFAYLHFKKGDFPVSEQASQQVLSLPIYPELSVRDQRYIIKAVKAFFNESN